MAVIAMYAQQCLNAETEEFLGWQASPASEKIYMKQPEGFAVKGKKELVCGLKSLCMG